MKTITWGILGPGRIAHRFTRSLQSTPQGKLLAISGRSEEKCRAFAATYHVDTIYLNHEDLLKDERIDAVYIALPHFMHFDLVQKALLHKKAVLCEKPAFLTHQEAIAIQTLAQQEGVLFMEAMKPRFLKGYQAFLKVHQTMGALRHIEIDNGILLPKESYGKGYHTTIGQGPGCLWDSGCYLLSFLDDVVGSDIQIDDVKRTLMDGIDMDVYVRMHKASTSIHMHCSFIYDSGQYAHLYYENGEIIVPKPHRPDDFYLFKAKQIDHQTIPYEVDDFYGQIMAFMKDIERGKTSDDTMPLAKTVELAKLSDAIRARF